MVTRNTLLAVLLLACSSQPTQSIVAAPNIDRHPPAQTSDGRVAGADDHSPERTLAEGVSTDHLAPGWTANKNGLKYDPKREPAGPEPGATRINSPDAGAQVVPNGQ